MKKLIFILFFLAQTVTGATHYFSQSGDNTTGLSWATAFTTLDSTQSASYGFGDTTYFGAGVWRGHLKVIGGTSGDRALYSCSTGLETTHGVKFYGSTQITGFEQYNESNVYVKAPFTTMNLGMLAQGDSLFYWRNTKAGVDVPGEWYLDFTNDSLFVYCYDNGDGYDPDNYQIEVSNTFIFRLDVNSEETWATDSAHYTTFYGLEFKYAGQACMSFYVNQEADSVIIERCKLGMVGAIDSSTNNPGCLAFIGTGNSKWQNPTVKACSLGSCVNYVNTTHGWAMPVYCVNRLVVDSCVFFGKHTAGGINIKSGKGYYCPNVVIKNSIFTGSGSSAAIEAYNDIYNDSFYNNYITGSYGAAFRCPGGGEPQPIYAYVHDNTIIGIPFMNNPALTCEATYALGEAYFYDNYMYYTGDDWIWVMQTCDAAAWSIDNNNYVVSDSTYYIYGQGTIDQADWETNGFDGSSNYFSAVDSLIVRGLDTTNYTPVGAAGPVGVQNADPPQTGRKLELFINR